MRRTNVREGLVEVEGHKLGYCIVNEHLIGKSEDPIVVFIHGVLASINFWHDCVPESFQDKPWFSLSLPGHSPAQVPSSFAPEEVDEEWFFKLMNGALSKLLGEKKAIIVGHSTGGFCALNLALGKAPNLVGIISVGGFYRGVWGGVEGLLLKIAGLGKWTKPIFVSNLRLSQKSRFIQKTFASLLANDRKSYLSNPRSQQMLENILPDVVQQNYKHLFPVFHGISKINFLNRLKEIDIPCYIFAGSKDPIISTEQPLVLASEIPHAKLVAFEGVGHMPFIEDAENYFTQLEKALYDINKQIKYRQ